MRNDTIVKKRVNECETLGREITTEWLKKTYENTGRDLRIHPTPLDCSVDLKCNLLDRGLQHRQRVNIEVKLRKKNERQLQQYPHGELKVSKYKRMQDATDEGTGLYYCVLLDNTDTHKQTLYMWDMNNLNWDTVGHYEWETKYCQSDPDSGTYVTPIYQIPFSESVCTADVTDLFTAYGYDSTKF